MIASDLDIPTKPAKLDFLDASAVLHPAPCDLKSLPLDAMCAFVLSHIDGRTTLEDVSEITGIDVEATKKMAETLLELGAIAREPPSLQPRGRGFQAPPISRDEPDDDAMPLEPPTGKREVVRVAPQRPARVEKTSEAPASRDARKETPPPIAKARTIPPAAKTKTVPPPQAAPAKAKVEEVCELDPAVLAPIMALEAMLATADHYALLGVEPGAEPKAIKRAYFGLAAKYHPDRFFGKKLGHARGVLHRIFVQLTTANDTLTNRERRAAYDATLGRARVSAPAKASAIPAPAPSAPAEAKISGSRPAPKMASAPPQSANTKTPSSPAPSSAEPNAQPASTPAAAPGATRRQSKAAMRRASKAAMKAVSVNATLPEQWNPESPTSTSRVAPVGISSKPAPAVIIAPAPTSARAPFKPDPLRATLPSPPLSAPPPSSSRDASPASDASPTARRAPVAIAPETWKHMQVFVRAADEAMRLEDPIGAANNYRLALQFGEDPELRIKLLAVEDHAKRRRRELSLSRATSAERDERWADAATLLAAAHEILAEAPIAKRAANALRKSNGDLRKAVMLAEYAVSQDPKSVEYRIVLAETYAAANLVKRATAECAKALELAPTDPQALALAEYLKKKK